MSGDAVKRTYSDAQVDEKGREIAMEAGTMLLAALRGGAALNPDRVSALSEAVHAGTAMIDVSGGGGEAS